MVRKIGLLTICLVLALAAAAVSGPAQKAPTVDLSGKWTGFTYLGDNSRADINLILEKAGETYTGKINDDAGLMPEMAIKNATFKEQTLSFDIEFPDDSGPRLIKIELKLEGELMKGTWADPDGNSNIIELGRKK